MSDTGRVILFAGAGAAVTWGVSRWLGLRNRADSAWGAEHDEDEVAPRLEPVPGASPSARAPGRRLSRAFDVVFTVQGMGLPVPYLRALAARESGLNPDDPKGLINVVRVVREDFNRRYGANLAPDDMRKPAVNVMVAADALRRILASWSRHHAHVPNLREDWSNREFVELLTFGWNAGWSETGGVGRVVRYLTNRGQTHITLNDVVRAAPAAGASHWLWAHPKKVAWTRSVADLYFAELNRDVAAGRVAKPAPAAAGASGSAAAPALELGRPVPDDVRTIVTSGWARARQRRAHRALDIPVPVGTPVLAVDDGVVAHVQATAKGDAGIWVAITHDSGLTSRYLHLSAASVTAGQRVARGDVIGRAGNTGKSSAPHLHLDLRATDALRATVERWIGTPAPGWGAGLARWGVSIPGEPFVPVDGYAESVVRDAARAGVPLRVTPSSTPPLVATAEPVSRPDQVDGPVGG